MGRPPLRVKKTTVRLPEGVAERIDALVGAQRRAKFLREAAQEKLEREEQATQAQDPQGRDR
jgi:Arc/MetJ-type ribon-helix-helix transcriptional regulator